MLPNVLLVVLDSTRARNTSLHGHERDTTPFLEEFADEATQYRYAYAPAPKSLTSHVSMFTGLHVEQHGVAYRDTSLAAGHTVWETLSNEYEYETGAFSANTFLTKLDVGLKTCFDHVMSGDRLRYENALDPREYVGSNNRPLFVDFLRDSISDRTPVRSFLNGVSLLRSSDESNRRGDRYVDAFLDWEASVDGPWAVCLNLMDTHVPYRPPSGHRNWSGQAERELMDDVENVVWEYQCGHRPLAELDGLECLYDDALQYADAQLARLYQTLSKRGVADRTLFVVTSDHGEGFGERSRLRSTSVVGHGESKVHESVLRVPLLVRTPEQSRGTVVTEPVSLAAFPSAVTDAIDGTRDDSLFLSDREVVATAVGLQDAESDGAGQYCDDLTPYTGRGRVLYEGTGDGVRKYMDWRSSSVAVEISGTGVCELPDTDVTDRIDAAFDALADADVSEEARPDVDPATYKELQELGYA